MPPVPGIRRPMDIVAQAWQDAWAAPDDRPIEIWGSEYIDLPKGGYAISGLFHVEKSRHLIKPFQALQNSAVRIVSARAAVQGQKSLLSDVWIPWTLANQPGPTLLSMQTEMIATQHAEARLLQVIKGCKPLARIYPDDRHKARTNSILFKNGVPFYVVGPALSNAQSKSIRYLSMDEVWYLALKFPGRIREFLARTSAYDVVGNSKTLITSQGGEIVLDQEGNMIGDDWALLWHEGNQSSWRIHCLHCHHRFIPEWTINLGKKDGKDDFAGMKWDDNGGQIRYECPNCRQAMIDTDHTKAEWNAHGDYVVTHPEVTHHESFTWPAWISSHWEPLVKEYLTAMQALRAGSNILLKSFMQKKAGIDWNARKYEIVQEAKIWTADFQIKKAWPAEAFRFMSVDVQANLVLFYVVVRAWASNGESRRLFRGQFNTWEAVRGCQEQFTVASKFVGVDSGFEPTKVYRQCCRYVEQNGRGWAAFAMTDQDYFTHHLGREKDHHTEKRIYSERQLGDPLLGFKNEDAKAWLASLSKYSAELYQRGMLKCPIYLLSRPSINDILQTLLDGKGAPFLSPESEKDEAEEKIYRQHMAGTVKKMKRDKYGRDREMWVDIAPQHYRSCEEIQIGQASLAGVITLEKPPPSADSSKKSAN